MRSWPAWLLPLLGLAACASPPPCAPADPAAHTIAFVADGAVRTMRADGSAPQTPVTGAAAFLAWSPAGDRLAVVRADPPAVILTNPDSGDSTVLRPLSAAPGGLAWSPAGDRLALADGPDLLVVARDGTLQATFGGAWRAVRRPAWSPDGRWLAFEHGEDGAPRLAVVSVADGTVYVDGLRGGRPQWQPGAVGVLLWQVPDDPPSATGSRLMLLDIVAEVARPLTDGSRAVRDAAWSPDGAQVAAVAAPSTLVVLDAATGAHLLAVELAGVADGPVWSRDGRWLALTEVTGVGAVLTVVDACSGAARRVADGVQPVPPAWR